MMSVADLFRTRGRLAPMHALLAESRSTYPRIDVARYARDLEDGFLGSGATTRQLPKQPRDKTPRAR